jgi:ADP-ribose pyrophosphatase YjhB (NUDIX family)
VKSGQFILDKAYSVLFLVARRKTGEWLLYKRGIHPLFGYTAFPVATPSADLSATETATRDLLTKTGLSGEFTAMGGGFFHMYHDAQLESYSNFTLLVCEDVRGELASEDPNGTYEWVNAPDFAAVDMLPNMAKLVELYEQGQPFFLEETLKI